MPSIGRRRALQGILAGAAAALLRPRALADGAEPDPVATTTAGRVRGVRAGRIAVFKDVPYGADTARRRFQAPLPAAPWAGIREAKAFAVRAPQAGGRTTGSGPSHGFVISDQPCPNSEDCLRLNVWTPALRDQGRRAVMVYFHGGAYSSGSANNDVYDGTRLCERGDVVVVTVNHRLNLFGYLYLAELGDAERFADSGNAGQLDLILALQWVRDNIEEFGGDPRRVMIFGQSGGGAKCATLMAMPAAHGLMHRVLSMSGQQVTASRRETATRTAAAVLKTLGIAKGNAEAILTRPMDELIRATRAGKYYGPVKDGRALPRDPFDPDAPPLSRDVPMVLGNTRFETALLIGAGDPSTFDLTWDTLPAKLERNSPFMGHLDRAQVIAFYRKTYPNYDPSDVFFAATTSSRSWRGQVIEAERRAAQPGAAGRTWVYELDWRTPVDGGRWRAPHELDIPLAFDNTRTGAAMIGTTSASRRMATTLSEVWIAFAKTGSPQTDHVPTWPAYTLTERGTMIFDDPPRIANDPRGAERRLFAPVPYVQPGT